MVVVVVLFVYLFFSSATHRSGNKILEFVMKGKKTPNLVGLIRSKPDSPQFKDSSSRTFVSKQ